MRRALILLSIFLFARIDAHAQKLRPPESKHIQTPVPLDPEGPNSGPKQKTNPIREFDFKTYLSEARPYCDGQYPVYIFNIEYFDLGKNGQEAAIVIGGDCNTGTAGPNIHSIYVMDGANPKEIEFSRESTNVKVSGTELPLIGNRNYNLVARNGQVCEEWHDGSERKNPKVDCYSYDGEKLVLSSISYGTTFPTSFDCKQAKSDREICACGNEDIGQLDRELDNVYRAVQVNVGANKSTLVEEQRRWITDREQYAYKSCEGIRALYSKRIQVFKDRLKK